MSIYHNDGSLGFPVKAACCACRYWESDMHVGETQLGRCRANPPVFREFGSPQDGWPATWEYAWCGGFEPGTDHEKQLQCGEPPKDVQYGDRWSGWLFVAGTLSASLTIAVVLGFVIGHLRVTP